MASFETLVVQLLCLNSSFCFHQHHSIYHINLRFHHLTPPPPHPLNSFTTSASLLHHLIHLTQPLHSTTSSASLLHHLIHLTPPLHSTTSSASLPHHLIHLTPPPSHPPHSTTSSTETFDIQPSTATAPICVSVCIFK